MTRPERTGPMRVGAVVLARTGSRRLPGKVLAEIRGRALLGWVLERAARVEGLDGIVVATSTDSPDEAIERWCREREIACFRGERDDVTARVIACAQRHDFDAVARVNADSPWLDLDLLAHAVALAREGDHDLVTNIPGRRWPYGISTEVVRVEALSRARALSDDTEDSEHVTRVIYRRARDFSILELEGPGFESSSEDRLVVDTPDDLRRFELLAAALGDRAAQAGTAEVVAAARSLEMGVGLK